MRAGRGPVPARLINMEVVMSEYQKKVARGAAVAFIGAGLVALIQYLASVDLGPLLNAILAALGGVLVNAIRQKIPALSTVAKLVLVSATVAALSGCSSQSSCCESCPKTGGKCDCIRCQCPDGCPGVCCKK